MSLAWAMRSFKKHLISSYKTNINESKEKKYKVKVIAVLNMDLGEEISLICFKDYRFYLMMSKCSVKVILTDFVNIVFQSESK